MNDAGQNVVQDYGLPDMELGADANWFKIIFKRKRENIDREQEGGEGDTESTTTGGMNKIDISEQQKEVLNIVDNLKLGKN